MLLGGSQEMKCFSGSASHGLWGRKSVSIHPPLCANNRIFDRPSSRIFRSPSCHTRREIFPFPQGPRCNGIYNQCRSKMGYNSTVRKYSRTVCMVSTSQEAGVFEQMSSGTSRKYIMISGKGGVGKTSLAASLAVKFAEAGHTTLVVSTDPAHSLSDSLSQDVSGGEPVPVEGTVLPIWGMEVDPDSAKKDIKGFAKSKAAQKSKKMAGKFGIGEEELASLKFGELLDNPPPGLDEAVALAKVVEFITDDAYAKFTRIVFDTAPTGHTLRLLNLPDFAGASLSKFIRLRKSLKGAAGIIKGIFGDPDEEDQTDAIDKLEELQNRIDLVKLLFQNAKSTEFIIATIPTVLGVNESARLLTQLRLQKIPCNRVIVNQLVGPGAGEVYLKQKIKDQERSLALIESSSVLSQLTRVTGPLLDLEVRRIEALAYFGNLIWSEVFGAMNSADTQKFVLVGGKGGVGKTTSAASLAVQYAQSGQKTLIVSTDPAHSLSDSLDQDLSGGTPVLIQGATLPLWGMEVNIDKARQDMKEAVSGADGLESMLGDVGLGLFNEQIKELKLGELLENPPPGSDEAVAIASVIQFLKRPEYSDFNRVVFDTAPTGHTLRLLTLPDFLEKTIGKILQLRDKIQSAADMVKGVFGGEGQAKTGKAMEKLEKLKGSMEEAKALFRDGARTEFVVVTIPTVMAIAESERLVAALNSEGILVRTLIVNQVLDPLATEKFLSNRRKDQERALGILKTDPGLKSLELIKAPLVDLEVRGVPALQYFGSQVWK